MYLLKYLCSCGQKEQILQVLRADLFHKYKRRSLQPPDNIQLFEMKFLHFFFFLSWAIFSCLDQDPQHRTGIKKVSPGWID
jgi:hypothetical protein